MSTNAITAGELKKVLRLHGLWLLHDKDGKRADLRDADLRGADLGGAYLSGAGLSEANLSGTDLRGANLSGADLRGANLRRSNLINANLGGANLRGANLRDANLRDANLRRSNLINANLGGADLGGTNLGENHVLVIGPIGSRSDYLQAVVSIDGILRVRTGCYVGTLDEFVAAVEKTHGDNEHGRAYRATIAYIKTAFEARAL